ncbi:MAG: response regulator [Thermodesulfobacteriota bacterium]
MKTAKSNIMVVDDDVQFRSMAKTLLTYQMRGDVLSCENGQAALSHLEMKNNIDIILSDINMPEMNGLELLTRIKQKYPNKTCILMSGDPTNEKTAREMGADAYINKPFHINEIAELLQTFVK